MLPVIVVGENAPRMEHISKSLLDSKCVPLRNLKIASDASDLPLPSLYAPSIIILDMESDTTKNVGSYLRRLKAAYYDSAVLVLLPFGDGHAEQLALEAGADDILMRPVSMNRLSLTLRNLSELVSRRLPATEPQGLHSEYAHSSKLALVHTDGTLKRLHHLEQEIIQHAVKHCHGHISQAARALGVGRSTLYRKIDALETRMKFEERMQKKVSFSKEASTAA